MRCFLFAASSPAAEGVSSSGRLAAALFSLFATLKVWQINPRLWLHWWYLQSCAEAEGQAPKDVEEFLPWNLSEERREKLRLTVLAQKTDSS